MPDVAPSAVLENEFVRLVLDVANGAWHLLDKRAGVSWGSGPVAGPWVALVQGTGAGARCAPLSLRAVEEAGGALCCRFADPAGQDAGLMLVFRGFGDATIAWHGRLVEVQREVVV
jgi:hypothetical protein